MAGDQLQERNFKVKVSDTVPVNRRDRPSPVCRTRICVRKIPDRCVVWLITTGLKKNASLPFCISKKEKEETEGVM